MATETPAVQTDERSLAEQAIGLFLEYQQHPHGYDPDRARGLAVQAMKDGAELRQQERVQELAERLVQGFLVPAMSADDWREKWKCVNRAAGVVVGWSFAVDSVAAAELVIEAVEELFKGGDLQRQLTDGLRKRVAEILVFLSGEA